MDEQELFERIANLNDGESCTITPLSEAGIGNPITFHRYNTREGKIPMWMIFGSGYGKKDSIGMFIIGKEEMKKFATTGAKSFLITKQFKPLNPKTMEPPQLTELP